MFTIRHGAKIKGRTQIGTNRSTYIKASNDEQGIEIWTNGVRAAGWSNGIPTVDPASANILLIEQFVMRLHLLAQSIIYLH